MGFASHSLETLRHSRLAHTLFIHLLEAWTLVLMLCHVLLAQARLERFERIKEMAFQKKEQEQEREVTTRLELRDD